MSKRNTYRKYTQESLLKAFNAVKNERISARKSSKIFQVPLTTLRDRLDDRITFERISSGPVSFLGKHVEQELVEHIHHLAKIGYGYTRLQIIELASQYAHSCKKLPKHKSLSQQWFNGFIKRWPDLKNIKPSSLDALRAKATNPEKIKEYFKELDSIMTKYNLKDRPDLIYNIDEKGISTEHKPPYVVCSRELKAQTITSPRSANTTMICMGNALGNYVPPFFVFPGARMQEELLKGAAPRSKGTVLQSGWSNSDTFKFFLQNHASQFAKCKEDEHMLWIYGDHSTHVKPTIIEWARSNRIILFVLPAHHSHILQPLDVGCFGPLQRIYNVKAQKYLRDNPGEIITRYEVAQLASAAYDLALSPNNLINSFKKTGIYPYNPDTYDKTKTLPNSVFCEATPVDVSNGEDVTDNQTHDEHFADVNAAVESINAEIERQNCSIVDFLETKTVKFKPKQRKSRKSVSKLVAGKAITELETFKKVCEYEQEKQNVKKSKPNEKGKRVKRQGSRSTVFALVKNECETDCLPSLERVRQL